MAKQQNYLNGIMPRPAYNPDKPLETSKIQNTIDMQNPARIGRPILANENIRTSLKKVRFIVDLFWLIKLSFVDI